VEQCDATDEFRSHLWRARHLKIDCPGRAQITRFRDGRGFGAERCEAGNQSGKKSGAAKEFSNAHVKAPSRLAQAPLSCKFENNFAAPFFLMSQLLSSAHENQTYIAGLNSPFLSWMLDVVR
jgi:hypothetical protein